MAAPWVADLVGSLAHFLLAGLLLGSILGVLNAVR